MARVLFVIILMIGLSGIEGAELEDLSTNLFCKRPHGSQVFLRVFSRFAFFFGCVKNCAAILGSSVSKLTARICWIYVSPEYVE